MKTRFKFNIDRLEVTYTCSEEMRELFASIADEHICGMDNDVRVARTTSTTYLHNFAVYCTNMYVGQLFLTHPIPIARIYISL